MSGSGGRRRDPAPLAPQTEYARSKVNAETALRRLADDRFSPTFRRNGTVYGLSPRMRFDMVLNYLMGCAYTTGRVVIHSDGAVAARGPCPRRRARVPGGPRGAIETIRNEAFNLGADHLNHQIRDLGRIVAETVPGCELVLARSRALISALTRRISPSSREPSRRSISSGRRVTGRRTVWRVPKNRPDARRIHRQSFHPSELVAASARPRIARRFAQVDRGHGSARPRQKSGLGGVSGAHEYDLAG